MPYRRGRCLLLLLTRLRGNLKTLKRKNALALGVYDRDGDPKVPPVVNLDDLDVVTEADRVNFDETVVRCV